MSRWLCNEESDGCGNKGIVWCWLGPARSGVAGGGQEENHIESLLHGTDFFFLLFFREMKLANALSEPESSGHKMLQSCKRGPLLAEDRACQVAIESAGRAACSPTFCSKYKEEVIYSWSG